MSKVRHYVTCFLTLAIVGAASAAESQPASGQHGSKATIGATHLDVSFFVVGRSTLHKRDAQGRLGTTSYCLFGEVFLRAGGQARSVTMTFPRGQLADFTKSGAAFRIKGRDFATLAELDQAFAGGSRSP